MFTVTTAVTDLRGNRLAAPYGQSFTVRESSLPFIVSFFPPEGSVVPVGSRPTVKFSERLQTNFFGGTYGVRLLDKQLGAAGLMIDAAAFDTITNTALLVPFKRMQSFRTYTVEVNELAKDLAGNSIGGACAWIESACRKSLFLRAEFNPNHRVLLQRAP